MSRTAPRVRARKPHAPALRIAIRCIGAAAVFVWLFVAAIGPPAPASPARAAGQNAAAIIVDDGTRVSTFCVRFDSESISGAEALQATGLPVVARTYGGMGAAICGVGGTGCGSGSDCLTCQAPRYWAYHRQASSDGFSISQVGAGATRVSNGMVEGWKWGTGAPPSFQSFASVCAAGGGTKPSTPTTAPAPGGSGTAPPTDRDGAAPPSGQGGTSGGGPTPGGPTDPASPDTAALSDPAATGTGGAVVAGTVGSPTSDAEGGDVETAAASFADDGTGSDQEASQGDSGGGVLLGWIAFGATLAALIAAIVAVRLRRNR